MAYFLHHHFLDAYIIYTSKEKYIPRERQFVSLMGQLQYIYFRFSKGPSDPVRHPFPTQKSYRKQLQGEISAFVGPSSSSSSSSSSSLFIFYFF
jgi:hypothetical protein